MFNFLFSGEKYYSFNILKTIGSWGQIRIFCTELSRDANIPLYSILARILQGDLTIKVYIVSTRSFLLSHPSPLLSLTHSLCHTHKHTHTLSLPLFCFTITNFSLLSYLFCIISSFINLSYFFLSFIVLFFHSFGLDLFLLFHLIFRSVLFLLSFVLHFGFSLCFYFIQMTLHCSLFCSFSHSILSSLGSLVLFLSVFSLFFFCFRPFFLWNTSFLFVLSLLSPIHTMLYIYLSDAWWKSANFNFKLWETCRLNGSRPGFKFEDD